MHPVQPAPGDAVFNPGAAGNPPPTNPPPGFLSFESKKMSLTKKWDVVIVGAGAGGATIGYALAKAGKRVLFCEKGRAAVAGKSLTGQYAETFRSRVGAPAPEDRVVFEKAGRWWNTLNDESADKARAFVPFIGSGTGGSTAIYGAALERLFPEDFRPAENFSGAHGADLPEAWPVTFDELQPYYREAEALYGVQGTPDPLKSLNPPSYTAQGTALSPPNQELHTFLAGKGLDPYRLPLACDQIPGCNGCQSYICAKGCKNDSAKVCLSVALTQHGATLWDDCEVVSIDAGQNSVRRIRCIHKGESVQIEAETFILAAGALSSPHLLLRSRNHDWPQGVANGSGLVGRYLMRHYVDLYAIFVKSSRASNGLKQLAFNNFYNRDGDKFGTVQSFGDLPPPSVLVDSIKDDLQHTPFSPLAPLLELQRPIMTRALGMLFGQTTVLASMMEDLPYRSNRIVVETPQDPLRIHYTLSPYEKARIKAFRKLLKETFSPYRMLLIKQAENNQRIAHACGTCRFGDDPGTSVLNRNNRAHELENLYVIDASFFPSSGGTNPALTIIANALRVADHLTGGKTSR